MRLLSEIDVSGRRVFVRADLDVPLGVKDLGQAATRLTNLKSTVDYLVTHRALKIIIAGHIDRPSVASTIDGKPEFYDPKLSTQNLIPTLQQILETKVDFMESFEAQAGGSIVLFENLRFWSGEVTNDAEFAKRLSSMAEIYVNESFGNSHRNHASMVALPQILPHAAGLHLEQEVNVLSNLLGVPQRPFIALVGGAKIETKLPVIENLAKVADKVLVGGELPIEIARLARSERARKNQKFAPNVIVGVLTKDTLELSQQSTKLFVENIKGAKTIIWNGPLGLIEKGFSQATVEVAKAICESGAYSVVGGGDTTQFLATRDLLLQFSFVSAGGGAMLEFLSGKKLPGIEALS